MIFCGFFYSLVSVDDIQHYQKIIVALLETQRLMQEIDKLFKP